MKREREPEGSLPLVKTLTEPQKILVLASLLPCGSCPYYCNLTGNPSAACVRCNKPARAHGDMNDTAEVDRKWGIFLSMVAKYEEQSVRHKELTTRMLAEMLAPVEPEPPLNAQPPFEALCIEDIVAGLVRDIQVRMTELQERDMIRQAGGLFNRLLQSTAFYKAVLETVGKRPMTDPELWELWRRHCHQCRLPTPEEAQKAPFMCDYCQAEFEAGTRVNKEFPLVTKAFGVRFMRAYIEDIKRVTSGMKEAALPPNSKPYLERLVREFEQELQLGPSSFVFRRTSQIRNVLSQPLQQHLRQRDGNNNNNVAKPVPPPPLAPTMPPPPVMPKLVRAPSVNDQLAQLATPPMPKKVKADNDGAPDSFLVKVVNDTKSPAGWDLLIGLKEVISKQLPEMPKYYIMRALFDGHHESLCVLKNGKVVGGCTFRPFPKQGFVEVVFLVVNPNTTNKGLGSLIMTEVKTFVHSVIKVDFLLTYADNTAIDFFKKQGFSKDITLARTRWAGYIKDYTKATLMEYHISPARDAAIAQQAQWVKTCINSTMDSLEVQKFSDKTNKYPLNPKVLGVNEERAVSNKIMRALKVLKRNRYIGPFLKPVDPNEAPNYLTVVKKPMSLEDVEKKFERREYADLASFEADLKQIAANCMIYNHESSWYYKYAEKLLEAIQRILY